MSDYTPSVKRDVTAAGAYRVGQGKGDHKIRYSPVSGRNFVIDGKIQSLAIWTGCCSQNACTRCAALPRGAGDGPIMRQDISK